MPSGVGLEVFVAFILVGCLVGAVFAGRRLREIPMPDVRGRRETLTSRLRALAGEARPTDAEWRWLEDGLARAGAGKIASREVITRIRERHEPPQDPGPLLVEEVVGMFAEDRAFDLPQGRLAIVLVASTGRSVPAGAMGKLAHRLAGEGRSVAVGTADTQRSKVMAEWAQRAGAQAVDGSSKPWTPVAATVEGAQGHDVLLLEAIRPARRGQPRLGPAEVRRAVESAAGRPPDAVVLVLDAATVAHVIPQARELIQTDLATGALLVGMDLASTRATALRVREALGLPVWFAATGAGVGDLEPFQPRTYASSLVR